MSAAQIAVVPLPGHGDGDATLASVRAEAGGRTHVVDPGRPFELPADVDVVAFARAGDRWLPGTLPARLRTLRAHPTAALSVAGHVLVDRDGRPALTVGAPALPLDPVELLLRASVEPSAALVRASVFDAAALALLMRPAGERVLWSRLARAHGLVRSTEVAAEVPLDPARHGFERATGTAGLLAAAIASAADPNEQPGAAELRRELLRRLYLDAAGDDAESTDLARLLGAAADDERVRAVVADLQWALERARDALAAERVQWPEHVAPDDDAPTALAEEELFDLRAAVRTMSADVELRDTLLRRYEAEILHRDAIIARKEQVG